MEISVRNVIARYRDEPDNQGPYEQEPDWVTHLENKARISPSPAKVVMQMLDSDKFQDTMKDTNPGVSTNPYDYDSPNTAPKDQGDSAPFVNEVPIEIDKGYYNRPEVFEEDKSLDHWEKVKEEDWTFDEDQQSPAMSLSRSPGAGRSASTPKTATTLEAVMNSDTHYKHDEKILRAQSVKASLTNKNNLENGLYSFRVTSPVGKPRRVYFQFLRPKDDSEHPKNILEYPVQLSCNCPSFLYYGAQYYAIHGRYLYGPGIPADRRSRNIAPTPSNQVSSNRFTRRKETTPNINRRTNPGRGVNFKSCKHILAAYNALSSTPGLLEIKHPYKSFPVIGPPLPIFSKKVWLELMGFEFNKENIVKILKKSNPTTPPFLRSRSISRKFIEWMRDVWLPRTDDEKTNVLRTLVSHPEEIFIIMLKDAYYSKGGTSEHMINIAFDMMDRVVEANSKDEDIPDPSPEEIEKRKKEEEEDVAKGDYPNGEDADALIKQEEEGIPIDDSSEYSEDEEDEDEEGMPEPARVENKIEKVKGIKSPADKEE